MKPEQALSENTKVTIGLIIVFLGGIIWLSTMAEQGRANAKAIESLQAKQEKIDAIQVDVAVIKIQLQRLTQQLERSTKRE